MPPDEIRKPMTSAGLEEIEFEIEKGKAELNYTGGMVKK